MSNQRTLVLLLVTVGNTFAIAATPKQWGLATVAATTYLLAAVYYWLFIRRGNHVG